MPPYANLGLAILTVLGALTAPVVSAQPASEGCPPAEGILTIQDKCGEHNDALTSAEANRDDEQVCRHLFRALKCVARKVPNCFDFFHRTMEHYLHSPHRCQFTKRQILMLQTLLHRAAAGSDETTPLNAPPAPSPTPTSTTGHTTEVTPNLTSSQRSGGDTDGNDAMVDAVRSYFVEVFNETLIVEDLEGGHNMTKEGQTHPSKDCGEMPLSRDIWTVLSVMSVSRLLTSRLIS